MVLYCAIQSDIVLYRKMTFYNFIDTLFAFSSFLLFIKSIFYLQENKAKQTTEIADLEIIRILSFYCHFFHTVIYKITGKKQQV